MKKITIVIVLLAGILLFVRIFMHPEQEAGSMETEDSSGSAITAEAYVREHITALSPMQAQLGGTYYVTGIEAHGGSGTVHYEDGHNAYVADFLYSADGHGGVSIGSFAIRDEADGRSDRE